MSTNLTEEFLNSLNSIKKTNIPKSVILQAKRCLLDYLGVTIAGAEVLKEKGNRYLNNINDNEGDSTIIGFNKKSNLYNTILLNGLSAHILDYDDGVNSGIIHLGSPIISALLPVVESEKLSGKELLLSIIIGYETALRLANSIQPFHKEKGYHASGTCGTIGAAISVGNALGFSELQLKDTLSAASSSAFGTLKVLEDGSELKPFNIAKASLMGFISAKMAKAGFSGSDDPLSGDKGFIEMMSPKFDYSKLVNNKEKFAVEEVYFKPYAACRYCHPSIEAALKIKSNNKINYNNINKINVETYYWAVNNHDHVNIEGNTSAKMSIPYSIAAALKYNKAELEEFSDSRINDAEVLSLTKKIKIQANKRLTEEFPDKSPAIVEITTDKGEIYKERIDFPKGEPENPMSAVELKEKFISLAKYGNKTEKEAERIIDCVWDIENKVDDLFELI